MVLLGGAYFGQIFCANNPSKNQINEIVVQNYSSYLISVSLLYLLGGSPATYFLIGEEETAEETREEAEEAEEVDQDTNIQTDIQNEDPVVRSMR